MARAARLPTIVVQRPRCPACGGVRLTKYRSINDQGDGSALWWVRCAHCALRFRVLLEPEEFEPDLPAVGIPKKRDGYDVGRGAC